MYVIGMALAPTMDLSGCLCVCGDWLGIHQKERSWLMGMNSISYGGEQCRLHKSGCAVCLYNCLQRGVQVINNSGKENMCRCAS